MMLRRCSHRRSDRDVVAQLECAITIKMCMLVKRKLHYVFCDDVLHLDEC